MADLFVLKKFVPLFEPELVMGSLTLDVDGLNSNVGEGGCYGQNKSIYLQALKG
jgi:hypothetical protein